MKLKFWSRSPVAVASVCVDGICIIKPYSLETKTALRQLWDILNKASNYRGSKIVLDLEKIKLLSKELENFLAGYFMLCSTIPSSKRITFIVLKAPLALKELRDEQPEVFEKIIFAEKLSDAI